MARRGGRWGWARFDDPGGHDPSSGPFDFEPYPAEPACDAAWGDEAEGATDGVGRGLSRLALVGLAALAIPLLTLLVYRLALGAD